VKKQDFLDWKNHEITVELFKEINTRIEDMKADLSFSAGHVPINDAKTSGMIIAYNHILNLDFEFSGDDE